MTTLPPHWTKVGMTRIVHCVTNIENINSGIQFYCKENNKKHQHFLENNKILNIVFKKTVYSDLHSKVRCQSDNGLWNVSPNIQFF